MVRSRQGRLQLTLPGWVTAEIDKRAREQGVSPGAIVEEILTEQFASEGITHVLVPARTPARLVIVRLSMKADADQRSGYLPGMSDDQWKKASLGYWNIAEKNLGDYLAAASPDGLVQKLWRVTEWATDEESRRRYAVDGQPVGSEANGLDGIMYQAVVNRFVEPQRNPVYIR